ncbi:MAG: hypothetical protein IKE21_08755 [Erysipelotrichaceae bacterium]|nr:hypothetical protein [Erysipelotrichaceae bacterium]
MLENYNDWISFLVLLALVVFSLQILMASVIGFKENSSTRKILQSVKDYADNEEA